MAYHSRSRDPFLDAGMQEAIEKRGRELLGLLLLGLGLAVAAMIGSYTPEDPNWLVSTDAPVQNWLGRTGASIAAPLIMVVGRGAWMIALVLVIWGGRLALHRGAEGAFGRVVFAPIVIALASIYCASLVPGAAWQVSHSYGLGGLFGDTVTGALLTFLPLNSHVAIKLLSLASALATFGVGAFVLGFDRSALLRAGRIALFGIIMCYGALMTLLERGAASGMGNLRERRERMAQRREENRVAQAEAQLDDEIRFEPDVADDALTEPDWPEPGPHHATERGGLLARVPALIRRSEPQENAAIVGIDDTPGAYAEDMEAVEAVEDTPPSISARIAARISDVIHARRQADLPPEPDPTRPLTKGRGRGPDPLILDTRPLIRPEPPLVGQPMPDEQPETAAFAPTTAAADDIAPDEYEYEYEYDEPHVEDAPLSHQAASQAQASALPPAAPAAAPRATVPAPSRRMPVAAAETEAFDLPPLDLLTSPGTITRHRLSDEALSANARQLETVLDDYGVKGEIVSVRPGPVVTMYELEPAPGLKASRVIGLADDIARSMSALSARVSTVPGRSVIGIELPNDNREMVVLREILSGREFTDSPLGLPLALGKDIAGDLVVTNLAKMPHLLIAGTTGSGKSVAINTMILSLLYKLTPEECRLIMIDPKMLELSVYDGIPHLLSPVVTDPKKAVVALKWVVGEMEDRYRKMSKMGVRNIEGYNSRVREALAKGETFSRTVQTGFDDETGDPVFETEEFAPETMPFIVVIVDEMADLMMVAGKEIEACIQRLAQMARASGIHMIMATQRPSVDVITGTIKANFPTRISFQVTSKIDSRTILGEMGAEQLLGQGDMLYMSGGGRIIRCHGPFVSDEEVEEVVNHLKAFGPPEYVNTVLEGPAEDRESDIDLVLGLGGNTDSEDALYDTAVQIVIKDRKCSTSYIQRKLSIGYNKAARLVEQMEDEGIVSAANHVGKREILVPEQG